MFLFFLLNADVTSHMVPAHLQVVKLLSVLGADLLRPDEAGATPYDWAMAGGEIQCLCAWEVCIPNFPGEAMMWLTRSPFSYSDINHYTQAMVKLWLS